MIRQIKHTFRLCLRLDDIFFLKRLDRNSELVYKSDNASFMHVDSQYISLFIVAVFACQELQ